MNTPDTLLKYAVEEIVTCINKQGMEPQAAVTKVAADLNLNANFIKRAAEVINVALHYNHFKKHADAKADDFKIVDATKVAQDVLKLDDKTAAQLKSEWFTTDENAAGINYLRYLHDPLFKEAFAAIVNCPAKETSFPTSPKGVAEKSANYMLRLEKKADEALTKHAGDDFMVKRAFSSLIDQFRRGEGYHTPWTEFEKQAFSLYGEPAVEFLDFMYKTAGMTEARGAHDAKYTMFDTCTEAKMFGEFLKHAAELRQSKEAVEVATHNLAFEKEAVRKLFLEYGQRTGKTAAAQESVLDQIRREVPKEAADPVAYIAKKKVKEAEDKRAARIEAIRKEAGGIVMDPVQFIQNKVQSEAEPRSSFPSTSPEDNRKRQFIFEELAATDPVLTQIEPHKLVAAYQQALHVGPELTKEKEIMRSYLRQAVSGVGGVDPFAAQQLISANSALVAQRQMQEGKQPKPIGKL